MGFDLFNNELQAAGFIIVIVFTPLAIAATVLRFMSTRITLGKNGREDWLALAALAFYLAWVVTLVLLVPPLNGASDILSLPVEKYQQVLKLIWIASLVFPWNQLFAKLSILCLYYRIFRIKGRKYVLWIQIFGALQIIVSVVSFILNIVQCLPIEKAWTPTMTGGWCINLGAMLAGTETPNSLLDFAMGAYAVIALRSLQTAPSTKWKLAIVFAMAGLAGVIGFIKIGLAFNVTTYNQITMGLWATVQGSLSVICCCAITYKPILARCGGIFRLASKVLSYGSRNKSRQTHSGESNDSIPGGWIDLERPKAHAVRESHSAR